MGLLEQSSLALGEPSGPGAGIEVGTLCPQESQCCGTLWGLSLLTLGSWNLLVVALVVSRTVCSHGPCSSGAQDFPEVLLVPLECLQIKHFGEDLAFVC